MVAKLVQHSNPALRGVRTPQVTGTPYPPQDILANLCPVLAEPKIENEGDDFKTLP